MRSRRCATALRQAVVRQMMADVPLGAFLSGGIDSSTLVALMSEASRLPINTFSMGFDDGSYNELAFAREVAAAFKTNHRERTVTPALEPLFDKLVVHLDEPFADVSMFPTYMVSSLAREHVTVALSGDGGDELFGGYDAYEAQALAAKLGGLGDAMMPALAARRVDAAADGEEEGPGQQGQAVHRGCGDRARRSRALPLDGVPEREAKARLYAGGLRDALAAHDVYAPVREALGRFSPGRCAEPAAVCGPERLPGGRHPREGRSDGDGHLARDACAVPRRRRDGAGVLDAGATSRSATASASGC